MRNVISLVLGGGRGTRLYPLTKYRSKPAVPLAGKYRLIDIPLSNCINSGLNRVYVLTQFNSVSLHRHIRRTYTFDPFNGGFVELLAAQQTIDNSGWYQGTADAVRQNLRYLTQPGIDLVLILSGDQLYRMDFADMIAKHKKSGAAMTLATLPVGREDAASLGIMKVDDSGRVNGFVEKPKTDDLIAPVRVDPAWIDRQGIPSRGRDLLGSMGIYLFNRNTLLDLLESTTHPDFGKEVIPEAIRNKHVQMYLFDGYWEDIGTIQSFYHANLALCGPNPPFDLSNQEAPIYSRRRFLPPSRLEGATVRRSLVADGCQIGEGAVIENSIIGLRCIIGKNVTIRNSIIMGNDYYCTPEQNSGTPGGIRLGIGDGSVLEGAIVDKNVQIGRNVRVTNDGKATTTEECDQGMVCEGIAMVPKEAVLPDDFNM